MIIRLLSSQIPTFWEAIKFSVVQVREIRERDRQRYLNGLLHDLLSDKAQCFVRLSDKRMLIGLLITKIIIDKISGEKSLSLQTLYSWRSVDDREWSSDFLFVKEFAKYEECSCILFETEHPRIRQISEFLGFREKHRVYIYTLE